MKKRIMLICAAGMSTSLLVTKMQKAAHELGEYVEIFALPLNAGKKEIANVDCVLLGPQVRFLLKKMKEKYEPKGIPVDIIPTVDYGTMNGAKVLALALKMAGK